MKNTTIYDDLIDIALDIKDKEQFNQLIKLKSEKTKEVTFIEALTAWSNGKTIQGVFGDKVVIVNNNMDEIRLGKEFMKGKYYILD